MKNATLFIGNRSSDRTLRLPLYFQTFHVVFIITFLFTYPFAAIAQNFPPASSCTSKDLELVNAYLEGTENCTITPGPKQLILKIYNKTGSFRTSFAFWGTLVTTDKDGNSKDTAITLCKDSVRANDTTTFPTNYYINYSPGSSYTFVNIYLAWTTASKKEICDVLTARPDLIAPKCGTLDTLKIYAGISAMISPQRALCETNLGIIKVKPAGGKAPYRIQIADGSGIIDSSGILNEHEADSFYLPPGTYTVYVRDDRPCVKEFFNILVDDPIPLSAPLRSITPPTCTIRLGAVTITNRISAYTYWLKEPSKDTLFFSTGTKSGLEPGTYNFGVTNYYCTTLGEEVTIDMAPPIPDPPTLCVTQPKLCGPSTATVTINAPLNIYGGDQSPFSYSKDSTNFQDTTGFTGLIAGSSPRFWVKNKYGCISSGKASCESSNCPGLIEQLAKDEQVATSSPKKTIDPTTYLGTGILESGVAVKTIPNPFGNKIRFVITNTEAGNGTLEIFTLQGQKIKTVYQGYIPAGTNLYDLTLPIQRQGELVYVLTKGTTKISGKLIQSGKQ